MQIAIPEQRIRVFQMPLDIRWGEMDALGHVNNVSYIRYIETVRVQWLASLGGRIEETGEGPVVVNTFCNFYRPVVWPGQLLLTLYVSAPGRSSLDTWVDMHRSDAPDVLCAAGGATAVWMHYATGRTAPLPQWMRDACGGGPAT